MLLIPLKHPAAKFGRAIAIWSGLPMTTTRTANNVDQAGSVLGCIQSNSSVVQFSKRINSNIPNSVVHHSHLDEICLSVHSKRGNAFTDEHADEVVRAPYPARQARSRRDRGPLSDALSSSTSSPPRRHCSESTSGQPQLHRLFCSFKNWKLEMLEIIGDC